MKILPSIHISNGRASARSGERLDSDDPLRLLDSVLELGFQRIALIDSDPTSNGTTNREVICRLSRYCTHKLQGKCCIFVNSAIKSSDEVQCYVDNGVSWLTVGIRIVHSPMILYQLIARFQSHLIPIISTEYGVLRTENWNTPFRLTAAEYARTIKSYGFKKIYFADNSPDSSLNPDFTTAKTIHDITNTPIIMSSTCSTGTLIPNVFLHNSWLHSYVISSHIAIGLHDNFVFPSTEIGRDLT